MSDTDLDKLVQELRADAQELDFDPVAETLTKAADALTAARGRIADLEDRLEMRHAYRLVDGKMTRVPVEPESIPDGIDCRDETIRQLEEALKEERHTILELQRDLFGALPSGRKTRFETALEAVASPSELPSAEGHMAAIQLARRALGGKDG